MIQHLGMHGVHHVEFFIVLAILLFMLYVPPSFTARLSWLVSFIEAHFGDSIGLYILHLGIALIILAGVFPEMTAVNQIGQSLVLAAMGVLKLTKTNGNGQPGPQSSSAVPPEQKAA